MHSRFEQIFRDAAAEDLAKQRRWRFCLPAIGHLSKHRRPSLQHGPTTFKWWLPIVVRPVAARSWGVQWRGHWNIWTYTRWNFNCCFEVRSCFVLRGIDGD